MKKGMTDYLCGWLLLGLCLLLTACGEDDYHYPSVKLEFLTAYSDADGMLERVLTDEGEEYQILADASASHTHPDSLVRIVSNYELVQTEAEEGVRLYAVSAAIAPRPLPADGFPDGVKTDPVDVLSIWMGRNYLNLILTVKAQNGKHTFHYVENQVTVDTDTRRSSVELTLYHDDGGDTQAYSQRAYCSVPLLQYAGDDVDAVDVSLHVHTYSGEIKTYGFEYRPLESK